LADVNRDGQPCVGEQSKWHFEGDHTGDVLTATWTAGDPHNCKR